MSSATDPTIPIATATAAAAPAPVSVEVTDADERMQILRLLENGDLSADEASDLLDAIDADASTPPRESPPATAVTAEVVVDPPTTPETGPARLRIRVSDARTTGARVNLTIPLGFLDAGYRLARRAAPGRIPAIEELHQRINSGFRGHLVDVNDNGDRVEILIE